MKTTIKNAVCVALLSFCVFASVQSFAATVPSAPQGSVSFQIFYDELSPYGSWVSYRNYGYAWIPSVGAGFTPYSSGGHWVYTSFGWTWASTYRWGWAPFHYGRWVYDDWYGWMWVPGYEWAPAWVTWGYYGNYYGWAPIGYGYGYGYRPPHNHWIFCESRYITQVNVHRYIRTSGVPRDQVNIIDNHDGGRNYYYGPRKEAVEKNTGRPVTRVDVVESNAPAQTKVTGSRMEIYRPEVTKGNAAPRTVKPLDEVKPVNKSKQTPGVQQRGQDDVYERGQTPERKSYTPQDRGKQLTPQQRTTPDVQERSAPQRVSPPVQDRGNMEKREAPQQRAPQVEDRGAPQRVSPPVQDRGNIERQQAPQQRVPRVQERSAPQAAPQQRSAPPVQQAPKQKKVTPR